MTAFRESIAETLSTVSKAKARSATLWGRVEKLRAFVSFYGLLDMKFFRKYSCLGYLNYLNGF